MLKMSFEGWLTPILLANNPLVQSVRADGSALMGLYPY
jgi:hypothetical protein